MLQAFSMPPAKAALAQEGVEVAGGVSKFGLAGRAAATVMLTVGAAYLYLQEDGPSVPAQSDVPPGVIELPVHTDGGMALDERQARPKAQDDRSPPDDESKAEPPSPEPDKVASTPSQEEKPPAAARRSRVADKQFQSIIDIREWVLFDSAVQKGQEPDGMWRVDDDPDLLTLREAAWRIQEKRTAGDKASWAAVAEDVAPLEEATRQRRDDAADAKALAALSAHVDASLVHPDSDKPLTAIAFRNAQGVKEKFGSGAELARRLFTKESVVTAGDFDSWLARVKQAEKDWTVMVDYITGCLNHGNRLRIDDRYVGDKDPEEIAQALCAIGLRNVTDLKISWARGAAGTLEEQRARLVDFAAAMLLRHSELNINGRIHRNLKSAEALADVFEYSGLRTAERANEAFGPQTPPIDMASLPPIAPPGEHTKPAAESSDSARPAAKLKPKPWSNN